MENTLKTIGECKLNIKTFADRFNLIFEEEGQCGLGRECVGLIFGDNYVDYNPCDDTYLDYIEYFYDERLYDIKPTDAYHKHDCIAVLGRGDDVIRQLSDWIDSLNELNAVIEKISISSTKVAVKVLKNIIQF
jgi:hypothetical protein